MSRPEPLAARVWSRVAWPFHCDGQRVAVGQRRFADVTADRLADAVVVAYCDAGAGSPPQHLVVLDGASPPGPPRVLAELAAPGVEFFIQLDAAGREVSATGLGFSRSGVPRCCPDVRRVLHWRWGGSGFLRSEG